jgi:hypothetical protein
VAFAGNPGGLVLFFRSVYTAFDPATSFGGRMSFRVRRCGQRVPLLKFLLFYGGMLAALLGTIFVWIIWRPKLIAETSFDEANRILRCTLRAARTFKPIQVRGIILPTEYVKALGASPPKGFKQDRTWIPAHRLYDDARRELVSWKGQMEIDRGKSVELVIPCDSPNPIPGTMEISYEYFGLGGVALMHTWINVPLSVKSA